VKYLLDSNIVIMLALGTCNALRDRLAECDEGDLVTSAIVLAEVARGSLNEKPPAVDELELILDEVPVLPFDDRAALAYATLPFGRASYDRLIAAHALTLGLTLVTANERDFGDIKGLRVENWTAA
jgi:tRNA(fMet)-specific endonuclease VapC